MARVPVVSYDVTEPDRVTAERVTPIESPKINQMEGLAQAFQNFAEPLKRAAIEIEDTENDAVTTQGFNQLSDEINNIMFNPETGYSNTLGLDAHKQRESTLNSINENYQSILNQLKTPMQRQLFQMKSTGLLKQTQRNIDVHAAQGLQAYNIGETKAAITNAIRDGANFAPTVFDSGDPVSQEIVNGNSLIINSKVDKLSQLQGVDPNSEAGMLMRRNAQSDYASQLMNRYLNKEDYVSAKGFLDYAQKNELLDPEQASKYQNMIENGASNNDSLAIAFDIADKFPGNIKSQMTYLENMQRSNPERMPAPLYDKVFSRLIQLNNVYAQKQAVDKNQVWGKYTLLADQKPNMLVDDLNPLQKQELADAGLLDKFKEYIASGNQYDTTERGKFVLTNLQSNPLTQREFSKLTKAQVEAEFRTELNNSDYETILALHNKLTNKATPKDLSLLNTYDMAKKSAIENNIFGNNTAKILSNTKNMTDDQSSYWYNYQSKLTEYLEATESANLNGKPLSFSEKQSAIKQFAKEFLLDGSNSFDNFKKGIEPVIKIGNYELKTNPDPSISEQVIQVLKDNYVHTTPRNEALLSAYYIDPELKSIVDLSLGSNPTISDILFAVERVFIEGKTNSFKKSDNPGMNKPVQTYIQTILPLIGF